MSDFKKSINASDLIRWIKAECNPYGRPTLDYESSRRIIEHIKSMSPVQPEIIRCKDCKYGDRGTDEYGNPFLKCLGWVYGGTQEEDFCSHAERRADER